MGGKNLTENLDFYHKYTKVTLNSLWKLLWKMCSMGRYIGLCWADTFNSGMWSFGFRFLDNCPWETVLLTALLSRDINVSFSAHLASKCPHQLTLPWQRISSKCKFCVELQYCLLIFKPSVTRQPTSFLIIMCLYHHLCQTWVWKRRKVNINFMSSVKSVAIFRMLYLKSQELVFWTVFAL